ncbi:MAG: 2-phospho-L-lactate guanylyltransferase [Candidatus Bathyarchaeota archaeon]|nr:2-phospho-L-lactate guanylyltransferase [Candidatus Bathyarchaeota archaeon]
MVVYAIVPVKKITASKRRLSQNLNTQQRKTLTITMLQDVLYALKASTVTNILVVSNDSNVKAIAQRFNVDFFAPTHRGLNFAIEEAFAWCLKNKADAVLVLPADLPLITSKDINVLAELGSVGQCVVLVPSKDWGTNALFQRPPDLVHASFGPESFHKHMQEATSRDVRVRFYYSLGAGLDIDSVDDLQLLLKIDNNTASRQVLEKFKAAKNADK